MRHLWLPLFCANVLVAGCCVGPVDPGAVPGVAPAPLAAESPPGTEAGMDDIGAVPQEIMDPVVGPLPVDGVPPAAPAAAAVAAGLPPGAPPAPPAAPAAPAAVPVGTLLASGTQYAYEDVGLTLTLPAGWTQQLMTGGTIALFSEDYPATGKRDRGALMMVSEHKGALPANDQELLKVLKEGLDPAATVEAGPVRLNVGGQPAAQVIAKATDADGAQYRVIHTILQSGGRAVSVKAISFDGLDRRKPLFDAVMESIGFSAPKAPAPAPAAVPKRAA